MRDAAKLCARADLEDLLLPEYLRACEEQNPGLVERVILAVSGEIRDLLAARYAPARSGAPALLRHIASVLSAYRVAQAVTSLVDTEASTQNQWLPLQRQWKECTELLRDLASGKLKPPAEEDAADSEREDAGACVVSDRAFFNWLGF